MKKRLLKLGLALAFIFPSSGILNAQENNTFIEGEKASFLVIGKAKGGRAFHLSANGEYLVGGLGDAAGFRYQPKKDSFDLIEDGSPRYVSNNGWIAGNIPTSNPSVHSAALWIDGVFNMLPPIPGNEGFQNEGAETIAYGISGDGRTIAGSAYLNMQGVSVYVGILWKDRKIVDTLLPKSFENLVGDELSYGDGGRPNGISDDGSTVYGFGSNLKHSIQRSPHVWRNGKAYDLGDATGSSGEVQGSSVSGDTLVGDMDEKSCIWIWDGSKYNVSQIEAAAGYNGSSICAMAENGLAVGYMYLDLVINRAPFAWTKETGMVELSEFLLELYGLDLGDRFLYTPMGISADGSTIIGFNAENSIFYSYVINLDKEKINSRPRALFAKQERNTLHVNLSWSSPLYNGREILGYNIYCNGEKINNALVTDLSYQHSPAPVGLSEYSVSAVYASGESKQSKKTKIQVIGVDGCYSVKRIDISTLYNKHVSVEWGIPTSEISNNAVSRLSYPRNEISAKEADQLDNQILRIPSAGRAIQDITSYENNHFDFIKALDLKDQSKICLFFWKGYYYLGDWYKPGISKLSISGELVETFTMPNLPVVKSITTDGENVYVGCGTKFIYQVDFEEKSIINQFPTSDKVEHLCYIPELDNNKGGFEFGDWNNSFFIDKEGNRLSVGVPLEYSVGTAFYKGKIYSFQQSGSSLMEVHEYDMETKQATGLVIDLLDIPSVAELCKNSEGLAGGINVIVMDDSTIALVPVVQISQRNNQAIFLELKAMPDLVGYTLYKNGEALSETPVQKRTFKEDVTTPGDYEYYVKAHFKSGCVSSASDTVEITINPLGECHAVKSIEGEEINGEVFLNWEFPEENLTSSLLGFNVYKDDIKLNEEILIIGKYTDPTVSIGKQKYNIEAFYDNSCVATDSIEVEVTKEGSCQAVNLLTLKAELTSGEAEVKIFDVNATWDLPYFESPYPLTYASGVTIDAASVEGGIPFTVGIGFDTTQLEMYRDFKLVGLELFLTSTANIEPIVLIDEKVVYKKEASRLNVEQYNRVIFDRAIDISTLKRELVVAYTASGYKEAPAGVDLNLAKVAYSDLVSIEPENPTKWGSSGLGRSWAMHALIAKTRDLETSGAETPEDFERLGGSIIQLAASKPSHLENMRVKALKKPYKAPEPIVLSGFNIYKDGTKLNDAPLSKNEFTDVNLKEGIYGYKIGAIYNTCGEVLPEKEVFIRVKETGIEDLQKTKSLSFYPNPVSNGNLFIEGDYDQIEISDLSGRILLRIPYTNNAINVSTLSNGMYMIHAYKNQSLSGSAKFIVE